MIAKLALVLSILALLGAAYLLSLEIIRRTNANRPVGSDSYINAKVLADQRSFLQAALRTVQLYLESGTTENRDATRKVIRLFTGNPILAASPVVSDKELSSIEAATDAKVIWVVTTNEAIEFSYPSLGGEFSAIVFRNIQRGLEYRYLVSDSPRARERRDSIAEDYPEIHVRLFDRVFWDENERNVDEFVIYSFDNDSTKDFGYYLYPRSNPRRWIKMDDESTNARLHDAEAQWTLNE